jgi:hypothetical protein
MDLRHRAWPVPQEQSAWSVIGKRRKLAWWPMWDERIYEEPEYAPPSRKTLLAIMRRKIGRGLQTLYVPPEQLPPGLEELVARLDKA